MLDALIGFDRLDEQIKKTKTQYYSTKKSKHLTIDIVNTQLNHARRLQRRLLMLSEQMKSPIYDFCHEYIERKSDYITTKSVSVSRIIAKYTTLITTLQMNIDSKTQKQIVDISNDKETSAQKTNILIRFWTHIKTVINIKNDKELNNVQ